MLQKICNTILTIILIIIIFIAGVLVLPKLFGYKIFAVKSGSMEPVYHVGSVVYVNHAKAEEIKIGDAISFYLPGQGETVATHRVTEIDMQKCLIKTKGDANEVEDIEPQSFDNLIGKVKFTIPLLGYISLYIKTGPGIIAVCAVLIVIILLSVIPELLSKDLKTKKQIN